MPRTLPALLAALVVLTAPPASAQDTKSSPPPGPAVFAAGELYVASEGNDVVLRFKDQALQQMLIGNALFDAPRALAFGPDGRLYAASPDAAAVFVLNAHGSQLALVALDPSSQPTALAFGPDGQLLVVDDALDQLATFNTAGAPLGTVDLPAGDYSQAGLAIGPDGHLFLSELASHSVLELDRGGALIRTLGAGVLTAPAGLTFGPDGLLRVADDESVITLDATGALDDTITGPALAGARGLAFGPDGHLFVAAGTTGNVVEFNAAGNQVHSFGAGDGLQQPGGLAFAPWRFKATITGSLARPDAKLKAVKEATAVVSILPGSRTLMLALTDDVSNTADLATVFNSAFLILHGFEGQEDGNATTRLFDGTQAGAPAPLDGMASLVLRIKGSVAGGAFTPKAAVGALHRAGLVGVYSATVKTNGLVK